MYLSSMISVAKTPFVNELLALVLNGGTEIKVELRPRRKTILGCFFTSLKRI
jgi:hypothetical protein